MLEIATGPLPGSKRGLAPIPEYAMSPKAALGLTSGSDAFGVVAKGFSGCMDSPEPDAASSGTLAPKIQVLLKTEEMMSDLHHIANKPIFLLEVIALRLFSQKKSVSISGKFLLTY